MTMLTLLASVGATFLFTCNQADDVILNVYQNQSIPEDVQQEIIDSLLEVTPPECSAHFYYS